MNKYINQTTSWIKTFVIGYNLCPFAAKPFNENRIKYVLVENGELEDLVERTFQECIALQNADPKLVETTLIIHPNVLSDFQEYIDVVEQMQEDLVKLNLEGDIQFASFHPQYQFAETNFDDPENFTNRSPVQMIHLLRGDSVEKAINLYPDTDKIPFNNIEKMNEIGVEILTKKRNDIIEKN